MFARGPMAKYHYNDSALIECVEVSTHNIGSSATIILKDDALPNEVEELILQLAKRDLPTMRDVVDGKQAIQVRGIKNEAKLFTASDQLSLEKHTTTKEAMAGDKAAKKGLVNSIQKSPLFLAALFYDLANAAFFVSGIQRGRHNPDGKFTGSDMAEMAVGGAFSAGDILMTIYGRDRGAEELSAASEGLRKHLASKGIDIPTKDTVSPDTLYQSGILRETHNWLHKNVLSVKCLAETAGGLFMAGSAMKSGNRNNRKLAAGLLISTGWFGSLMLEKPRGHKIFEVDTDKPLSAIEKAKHNPRAWLASPASIANNFLNISGSLQEKQRFKDHPTKKNDYVYNLFSACAFLVANSMFAISGKRRPAETEEDKQIGKDLILIAANTLASQPNLSKDAIDETAEYVSTRFAHIKMNKEEATNTIMAKVAELNRNTWVSRTQPSSPPDKSI